MQALSTESKPLSIAEFVAQSGGMMIPLGGSLAYCSIMRLDPEESDTLIHDPATALPPGVCEIIPNLRLVMVPYLHVEPNDGGKRLCIAFSHPDEECEVHVVVRSFGKETYLFLAVGPNAGGDAHSLLFGALSEEIVDRAGPEFAAKFNLAVDSELDAKAHGEVHDEAWTLKQELLARNGTSAAVDGLRDAYRRQALVDTLTLYLHGLCCDISVESGPKQLPSRFLRTRLLLLRDKLPPPDDVALFPEDLELP